MRISDWSSDVCSSDLKDRTAVQLGRRSRLALCDLFFREAYPTQHEDKEVMDRISGRSGMFLGVVDDFNWTDDAPYFQVEATDTSVHMVQARSLTKRTAH